MGELKPTRMLPEVSEMIQLRHSSEQRGHFSPLGRLLWMQTEHGRMDFASRGFDGLDLAQFQGFDGDSNLPNYIGPVLLVLGSWYGLPDVQTNTGNFCSKCLNTCDVCSGTKKKLCELCGGNGSTSGSWLPCPGEGCTKETGNFKPGCTVCHSSGQVAEQRVCACCGGKKEMTCPRCRGTGEFPTGREHGLRDLTAPKCSACDGSLYKGKWDRQDVKRFRNAQLLGASPLDKKKREFLWDVLGPIHSFALQDFASREPRIFDVYPDVKNDLLFLIVPSSTRHRTMKAYLVGGVARERQIKAAVSA